jgi:hypothetical protein
VPFLIVDILSLAPVPGTNNSDPVLSIGKANRHDSLPDFADAVVPSFDLAMANILRYDAVRIAKCVLCQREWDTVLLLVLSVLLLVPFKSDPFNE